MNFKLTHILPIVFNLSLITSIESQKVFNSGQFNLIQTVEKLALDADTILLKNKLSFINFPAPIAKEVILYNSDTMAIVTIDTSGDILRRKVCDYKNRTVVEFQKFQGIVSFNSFKLNDYTIYKHPFNHLPSDIQDEIISIKDGKDNFKGFKYKTVTIHDFLTPKTIYYITDELNLPFLKYSTPKALSIFDSTIYLKIDRYFDNEKILISTQIDSFSPNILNFEWMSMSTEGVINEHDREYAFEEGIKIPEKKLNYIENGGVNSNIAIDLMNSGFLTADNYNEYEKGMSIDKYYLLKESFSYCKPKFYDQLFSKWIEYNLISEESILILKNCISQKQKNELNIDIEKVVIFLALKDIFENKNNRQFIFDEINTSKYGKKHDFYEKGKLFVKGKIDFSEFIYSLKNIYPIELKEIATSENEIITKVNLFLLNIFGDLNPIKTVNIKSDKKEKILIMNTNEYSYEIPFEKLFGYYFEREILDSFEFNENFYNSLITIIRQINTDYDLNTYVGINKFIERINFFHYEDYLDIIEKIPQLKLFKNDFYLTTFTPNENVNSYIKEIIYETPLSIHELDENRFYYQCKLKALTRSQCDICSLIKTSIKIDFYKFLEKEKKTFELDNNTLKEIKKSIIRNQFEDIDGLLDLIPNISYSISHIFTKFPTIEGSGKSFKEIFPNIDGFLKGTFNAKNLRVDPFSPYILEMDYKGKTVGVKKEKGSLYDALLKIINNEFKNEGKGIYTYSERIQITNTTYYYLTDSQKNGLEKLLNIKFRNIK